MCCLFGMIDHQQRFSAKEKSRLLSVLAAACEVRGTDASGVAYNAGGRLRIYKRPVAAHKLDLRIPYDAKVIMGHTRMTTQGAAKRNCNNHPFRGNLPKKEFALAHNGILYNDHALRRQHALLKTKIETDSYIAVQLIEQKKALDTESLRFMAEQVQGSFTFTILDEKDRLYIIKGSNPLCLYHFPEQGVWFYTSTKEILDKGLAAAGFLHHPHERLTMDDGEILCIAPDGKISRDAFQMQPELYGWYYAPFMQELVGGLVEDVSWDDEKIALICNDEGLLLGLPPNRSIRWKHIDNYTIIHGDFFLCGVDGENYTSLPPKLIEFYAERFRYPEIFLPDGEDGVISLTFLFGM